MAKPIMIQGTMSNAGKSAITAALCRIFKQDGYRVAPFKSQNMALNSYITTEGLEIGRAQAVQAFAAGVEPSAAMNPILLKPTSDQGSQVIVNGEIRDNMNAADYFKYKKQLIPDIMKAYTELDKNYDIIVIEGAGSPVELNLKENDIVNMGMAEMADAPVLLVGDIDRGGIFPQLYGTVDLLEKHERERVKGLIVNKFRGDKELFKSGIGILEEITDIRVAGVIPYGNFKIDDEDSLSESLKNKTAGTIDIAVIQLPKISNFTDFTAFEPVRGVSVRYVENTAELGNPDMIIIPGTKNTIADLLWMRDNGLEAAIKKYKGVIFGICGGYQMLGEKITDSENVEGGGSIRGMELLPMTTEFRKEKTRTRVNGVFENIGGVLGPLKGMEYEGYEIHMGESAPDMKKISGSEDSVVYLGNVYGTYIHGIFDTCAARAAECLGTVRGITLGEPHTINKHEFQEIELNRLADMVRESLDMELIYKILNKEI